MASKPIDDKIMKLSVDDSNFKKNLQSSINFLKEFQKSVETNTNVKSDKFQSGISRIGESVSGLLSKIPILNRFSKAAEESTDVKSSPFESFAEKVGNAANGLLSKIPIFRNFKKEAQDSLNIDGSKGSSAIGSIGNALGGLAAPVANVGQHFSALEAIAFGAFTRIGSAAVNLGAELVNSMSFSKISEGFKMYESQSAAVLMLQGALGKGATGEINSAMADLAEYARTTKYSISDMNTNLSQFVNNGVGLKDSQVAIKGWGNLAASAGASTQAFASSLQFGVSQALAMGKMTTQNWMSVENAGMATQKFKDALVQTGNEMGKNTNQSNGFRDSLQSGWLTSDVFIASMKKMAENEDMVKVASQFHSFSEVSDAVSEGIVKSWSDVFGVLVGDIDQATGMWTAFGNTIADATTKPIDNIKALATEFVKIGGREAVLNLLTTAWKSLTGVINSFKQGWGDVFAKTTESRAQGFLKVIKNITEAIKVNDETLAKIVIVGQGVASIFSIVINVLKLAYTAFSNLLPKGMGGGFLDLVVKISQFIVSIDLAMKQGKGFNDVLTKVRETSIHLRESITALIPSFDGLGAGLKKIGGGTIGFIVKAFNTLSDSVKALFKNFNSVDYANLGILALLALITAKLSGVSKYIKGFGNSIKGVADSISGAFSVFDKLGESLGALTGAVKAATLLEIAIALGILSVALVVLSTIKVADMVMSLTALAISLRILTSGMTSISASLKPLQGLNMMVTAAAMIAVATAMLLISGVVKILSMMSPTELAKGLFAFAVAMGIMVKGLQAMSDIGPKIIIAALAMNLVAAAMTQLLIPIVVFSKMKMSELAQGLGAMAISLFILTTALNKLSTVSPKALIAAPALVALSVSLLIMASAIRVLGSMSMEDIAKGLGGLAGSVVIMGAASKLIGKPVNLIAMATGLVIMAQALKMMGDMQPDAIGQALIALAGSMVIMAAGMRAMGSNIGGSISLVLMAAALIPLAQAMKMMGALPMQNIEDGLKGFGGALALLVLAARGLNGAIVGVIGLAIAAPAMLIIAQAMLILTVSIKALSAIPLKALGVGLLAMAAGLGILIAAGYLASGAAIGLLALGAALVLIGASAALVGIAAKGMASAILTLSKIDMSVAMKNFQTLLDGLLAVIPKIIQIVINAAAQILVAVIELSPKLRAAGQSIISDMIALLPSVLKFVGDLVVGLGQLVPKFIDLGVKIVLGLSSGLVKSIPKLADDGLKIVLGILQAIDDNIADIASKGVDIVVSLATGILGGISSNIPKIVGSIMQLAIAMINGLADGITVYGPVVNVAIMGLFNSIMQQIITTIADIFVLLLKPFDKWTGGLSEKVNEVADAARDGLNKTFSEQQAKDMGIAKANGYVEGLNTPVTDAKTAGEQLAEASKEGAKGVDLALNILGAKGGTEYAKGIADGSISANDAAATLKEFAAKGASGDDLARIAKDMGGSYVDGIVTFKDQSFNVGSELKKQAIAGANIPAGGGLKGAGETSGLEYTGGILSNVPKSKDAGSILKANLLEGTKTTGEVNEQGAITGQSYNDGVASKATEANTTGVLLRNNTQNGVTGGDLNPFGTQLGGTFTAGVNSKSGEANAAGVDLKTQTTIGSAGANAGANGANLGGTFTAGVNSKSGEANAAGNTLKGLAQQGTLGGNASSGGSQIGTTYGQGITDQSGNVRGKASSLGDSAKAGADSNNDMSSSGKSMGNSFADGISNAANAVGKAAGGLLDWAKSFFPHSPAKRGPLSGSGWTFIKSAGAAIANTFSSGITDSIPNTGKAISKWMGSASDVLSTIVDGMDNNFEFTPVITPVVDMSNIDKLDISRSVKMANLQAPGYGDMNITTSMLNGTQNTTDRIVSKLAELNESMEYLTSVNSDQLKTLKDNAGGDVYIDKEIAGKILTPAVTNNQNNSDILKNMLGGIRPGYE